MSRVVNARKDRSCILCLTPRRGGTWHSRLKAGVVWPLIIKTNVKTNGRYFEAADTTQPVRIETPLDLRGIVSDYTVVVDFEAAALPTSASAQQLAGQGASVAAAGHPAICALGYYRDIDGAYRLLLSQEIAGIRRLYNSVIVAPLTGRHVAAGVVTIGGSSTTLCITLDGVLLGKTVIPAIPTGAADAAYTNFAIGDNRLGTYPNQFGKIYAAALFNRALSAPEIAYLSKSEDI